MALTQEEIDKLYQIRDNLRTTYRASIKAEQKRRIAVSLKEVESIIEDVEKGNWVNPVKVNLFTKEGKQKDTENPQTEISYKYQSKIVIEKLTEHNTDKEIDIMYSYFNFFSHHFLSVIQSPEFKLEYEYNRRKNDIITKFEKIETLINEYADDVEVYITVKGTEQESRYKERLLHQKNYLLIKIDEALKDLNDFLKIIIEGSGSKKSPILINAEEEFYDNFSNAKNSMFFGTRILDVIIETRHFIEEFIHVLRIPNFKRR
ncbi:MAG: hypothetical protein MJB14_10440 [Spirochaetes bacterium]|nr:hypothetical protein [Spirochaetota bacterium]